MSRPLSTSQKILEILRKNPEGVLLRDLVTELNLQNGHVVTRLQEIMRPTTKRPRLVYIREYRTVAGKKRQNYVAAVYALGNHPDAVKPAVERAPKPAPRPEVFRGMTRNRINHVYQHSNIFRMAESYA
jgi:hypothetical protein